MASGGQTAKGTVMAGVVKTQLGTDQNIPSTAREIVNLTPYGIPITFTADLEMLVLLEVESNDFDTSPTTIPVLVSPPENGTVTTGANSMVLQTYKYNQPVKGGDVVQFYGTNINDPTTDPNFGCGFMLSDQRSGKPRTYFFSPTATTAYGTGNDAYVAGTTYRWSNSRRINTVGGLMTQNTVTISDSTGGTFKLVSNDFKTQLPQVYPFQTGFANVVAASTSYTPKTAIWNVDIPTEPIIAVTEEFQQEGTTLAGNASFISFVGYEKLTHNV